MVGYYFTIGSAVIVALAFLWWLDKLAQRLVRWVRGECDLLGRPAGYRRAVRQGERRLRDADAHRAELLRKLAEQREQAAQRVEDAARGARERVYAAAAAANQRGTVYRVPSWGEGNFGANQRGTVYATCSWSGSAQDSPALEGDLIDADGRIIR